MNETELEVSSDSASYKQRLEVLQQQEELIEDEEEQEAKESEARRVKKEQEEEIKREEAERKEAEEKAEKEKMKDDTAVAADMLPEEVVSDLDCCSSPLLRLTTFPIEQAKDVVEEVPAATDPADVRMTSEQVTELGQALEILSAKSSVLKERTELKRLMDENKEAEEEVCSRA